MRGTQITARPTTRKTVLLLGSVLGVALCGCNGSLQRPVLADGFAALVRGDTHGAVAIYRTIADQQPDTLQGAVALDAITEITGRRLFPQPTFECSAEARARYAEAERQFAARAMEAALAGYQAAITLCPLNADWWVHSGDAYFGRGEYEHARTLYTRGLQIDPWNRSAHRFLADAAMHLDDLSQAYRSAVLAVVSDPTYEAGWQFLKELTRQLGGQWNRRRVQKPYVGREKGEAEIVMSPVYEERAALAAWLGYATVLWNMRGEPSSDAASQHEELPAGRPSPEQWRAMSAIERERFQVDFGLGIYRKLLADGGGTKSGIWGAFTRAAEAGLLDEAIFIHLMDADLAALYPTYRLNHTQRLIEYVTTIVAPLPPSGSRPA